MVTAYGSWRTDYRLHLGDLYGRMSWRSTSVLQARFITTSFTAIDVIAVADTQIASRLTLVTVSGARIGPRLMALDVRSTSSQTLSSSNLYAQASFGSMLNSDVEIFLLYFYSLIMTRLTSIIYRFILLYLNYNVLHIKVFFIIDLRIMIIAAHQIPRRFP